MRFFLLKNSCRNVFFLNERSCLYKARLCPYSAGVVRLNKPNILLARLSFPHYRVKQTNYMFNSPDLARQCEKGYYSVSDYSLKYYTMNI